MFICFLFQEEMFYKWINQTYLDTEVQTSIKEKFESESEIELEDFLQVRLCFKGR